MKFMVRAGWQDFEVESQNPDAQYAAVVWQGAERFVWVFEEEAKAERALKREMNKRMMCRGGVYWMRAA